MNQAEVYLDDSILDLRDTRTAGRAASRVTAG